MDGEPNEFYAPYAFVPWKVTQRMLQVLHGFGSDLGCFTACRVDGVGVLEHVTDLGMFMVERAEILGRGSSSLRSPGLRSASNSGPSTCAGTRVSASSLWEVGARCLPVVTPPGTRFKMMFLHGGGWNMSWEACLPAICPLRALLS